jgi:hypothetical protein
LTSSPDHGEPTEPSGQPLGKLWRIPVGVLWALVAAELFLRIFAPVPMLPRYVIATDFGIRGNQPNQTYTHRTPDYTVEIRTNSRGIRADEKIPYQKPPGVKRILVLGDSFSVGYGVDLEDAFSTAMKRLLEQEIGPVQIVNLSVSGHGNAEELIMLREEGRKYEPDLILLGWHRTDLDDNVRSGLFGLEAGGLVRRNASFLPQVKLREFFFRFAAYRWLAGNCHLYNLMRERVGEVAKSLLATARSTTRKPEPPAETSALENRPPPGGAEKRSFRIQLTLALLGQILREARAGRAELLVLDIPNTTGRSSFNSAFPDLTGTELSDTLHVVSPIEKFSGTQES